MGIDKKKLNLLHAGQLLDNKHLLTRVCRLWGPVLGTAVVLGVAGRGCGDDSEAAGGGSCSTTSICWNGRFGVPQSSLGWESGWLEWGRSVGHGWGFLGMACGDGVLCSGSGCSEQHCVWFRPTMLRRG